MGSPLMGISLQARLSAVATVNAVIAKEEDATAHDRAHRQHGCLRQCEGRRELLGITSALPKRRAMARSSATLRSSASFPRSRHPQIHRGAVLPRTNDQWAIWEPSPPRATIPSSDCPTPIWPIRPIPEIAAVRSIRYPRRGHSRAQPPPHCRRRHQCPDSFFRQQTAPTTSKDQGQLFGRAKKRKALENFVVISTACVLIPQFSRERPRTFSGTSRIVHCFKVSQS
jgi:hypothetical protein